MGDIPTLDCDGFPFHNDRDAYRIRVLVAALEPQPEAIDVLLNSIDAGLAYAARYRAARAEVESYDHLVRAFSPLEVEQFRARREEFAHEHGDRLPMRREVRRRHARRPPRANVFAPPDGQGGEQADSASPAEEESPDVTSLLAALVSARVEAARELRALRDGLDHLQHADWLRALHDAITVLMRAGKAKVTW
jgi:hypothetical protein